MAAYLINKINLVNIQILDVKFHKKLELLAISTIKDSTNGDILIANTKGTVYDECTLSKPKPPSMILWHPTKSLLAVGWTDGMVTMYDGSKNISFDASHVHNLPISCFSWSSHGSRLVSADIEGNIFSWKIDFNNGFSQAPMFSYQAECPVNCMELRITKLSSNDVYDIRELARAAVSGDQKAMDLMSSSETKNIKFTGYSYVEVATFLAGLSDGRIILINENGKVFNITSLEGSVVRMLYHEERDIFIATTNIGYLAHYQLMSDCTSKEVMKVKLACRTSNPSLIWAGSTTLAICLGEHMIRMWDIDREENFILQTEESLGYVDIGNINVVDYSPYQKTLVAGTSNGKIISWKLNDTYDIENPESRWCLQPVTNLQSHDDLVGSIEKLVCSSKNHVGTTTNSNLMFLLEECDLASCFNNGIVIQQINAKEFVFHLYDCNLTDTGIMTDTLNNDPTSLNSIIKQPQTISNNNKQKINMNIAVEHGIRKMACTKENIIISDGDQIYAYELSFKTDNIVNMCGKFECNTKILNLHQQNIYVYVKNELQIRNFQGIVKQSADISGMDGEITHVEINNNFMVCATSKCYLKVFDLSRRDPKPISAAKDLSESIPSVTKIKSISINCTGSGVSLIIERQRKLDAKLYFWDVENDSFQYFNFASGLGEQDDYQRRNLKEPRAKQLRQGGRSSRNASRSVQRSARSRYKKQKKRQEAAAASGDGAFSVSQSILYDAGSDDEEVDENIDQDEESPLSSERDNLDMHMSVSFKEIHHTVPILHMWDKEDERIVVVAVVPQEDMRCEDPKPDMSTSRLASLFVTQDDGIMIFDSFKQPPNLSCLIGFDVPYFYFSTRIDEGYKKKKENDSSFINTKIMRDFQGLDTETNNNLDLGYESNSNSDQLNKKAIINFSYYLTIGNMDEAFKAMKLIKSEQVWQNMARMCVKTKRLDVATVCLGRMNFGRAAMHLREAKQTIPEIDAKIAMLAVQMDMKEEAIELLKRSKRYDILNELYQAMAEWDLAINIAENHDRIHLKTTYYNYAKYLEEEKRYTEAVQYFVKSGTHTFEVPRMLLDDPEELSKFIRDRSEKSLKRWWAQYMECVGDLDVALKYYEAANDYFSLVRIYWLKKKEKEALRICDETGDTAACYHTARQFEAKNDVDKAIHYFSRARAYNNAIRVCQENNRDEHLVNLALLGKPEDQVAVANYLQNRPGYEDKAVMLYHKAGQISRAINLAFQTRQFSALQYVTTELAGISEDGVNSNMKDPALIQKCAQFFMENNQFDRAVDLLASNKQLWDALKLCVDYNVLMTEELAEKLTPQRPATATTRGQNNQESTISTISSVGTSPNQYTDVERCRLLEGIAEVALTQRQYHVACKKFTQAGNQLEAMKSLLKSGDTQKIVFFANVAKTKDVYVLAANYLQTLDWRSKQTNTMAGCDILKTIVQFYTRGKALERLATFYEATAQSEIEEYHDYSKALTYMADALKCWNKVKFPNENQKEDKIEGIRDRCTLMQKFAVAVKMLSENPDEALQHLQLLLDDPHLERGVRYGDVYASMIQHFMNQSKYKAAYSCLEEMKTKISKQSQITAYLDMKILEKLHKSLNLPFRPPTTTRTKSSKSTRQNNASNDDGDTGMGVVGSAGDDDDGNIEDEDDDEMDDVIDDRVAAAIDEDL